MSLLIGARGWEHAAWQGGFYPDDLPEDWRLAYYANEFRTVMLPETVWSMSDGDMLQQWRDDAGPGFCFCVQMESVCRDAARGLAQSQLAALARCHEYLGSETLYLLADDPACRQVLEAGNLPAGIAGNLCFLQSDDMLTQMLGNRYRVQASANRKYVLLSATGGEKCDLRVMRAFIETLVAGMDDNTDTMMFFDGQPPSVDDMQNARIIADLLGIS